MLFTVFIHVDQVIAVTLELLVQSTGNYLINGSQMVCT